MSNYYGQSAPGLQNPTLPTNANSNIQATQSQGAIQHLGPLARRQSQPQQTLNPHQQILDSDNDYPFMKNIGGDLYQQSRAGFIRKVYTLLSIQLIITALICVWAMNSQTFKNIFDNTPALIILSVLLMVMSIGIGCCPDFVRNYGLPILFTFTIVFGLFVGIICAKTKPEIVLAATAITALVVIGLTIFSCVTKSDLTGCGPFLFLVTLVMIVFGIACIFWRNPIVHLVYACLAALLYGIYLIFDTQMVLGRFQFSYSLDDAYFAAIMLYIDIMELFLQILQILSYANN